MLADMKNVYHPKISLLIPIYNVERYLQECLASAQAQTLKDIEVICINDGSTDESRGILEGFLSDARFRVIDKKNSGYGASMNQGLDVAQGEYIAILESDDFLDPDALEVMFAAAQQHDADLVKCDFYRYWAQPAPRNERFGFVSARTAGPIDPYQLTDVFYLKPSIWSSLYRRSFLEQHSIRFLETPGASFQDTSFNFKAWADAERVVLVDRAVLHYRQDNESSSINSTEKAFCICTEYDEIERHAAVHPKRALLQPIVAKMRQDVYLWNYERLSDELKPAFIRRMAEDFRREDAAGTVDYAILEPWKVVDRRMIIDDPEGFHRSRQSGVRSGHLQTLKRCFAAGGLPLAARAVLAKLRSPLK